VLFLLFDQHTVTTDPGPAVAELPQRRNADSKGDWKSFGNVDYVALPHQKTPHVVLRRLGLTALNSIFSFTPFR
jgi:hypothetical protein